MRVADLSTFYALPEGRLGIFVGGGASVRVGRVLGADRMREMMLTEPAGSSARHRVHHGMWTPISVESLPELA